MSEDAQNGVVGNASARTPGPSRLRVLLVEDNPGDVRLLQEMLVDVRGLSCELRCADSLSASQEHAAAGGFDLILLDLSLPDSQGMDTFREMHRIAPDVPVVVLTGLDDRELALRAVREGAQDYLVKGRVDGDLLERVMRYSIERHKIQKELQDLNANLERRVAERTQELSTAYDALAQANEDLRELDRMKSAFISVTSHELRTPLVPILGMLNILKCKLSEAQSDLLNYLQSSLHAGQRLARLADRVQAIWDSGQYDRRLSIETVAAGTVVREAVREVYPFIELRKQALQLDIPEDLPPISIDNDKIQDVLVNLLMNAVKFTPDGGNIGVAVRLVDCDRVEFRVSDTGIGISEEDKPHVFEAFFSGFDVEHHSSGEYEFEKRGIGLGLAIVKEFVEMHGGTVGVESTREEGSVFHFTVPVKTEVHA